MKTNIGVSIVCPGTVKTRIHESWRNRPETDETWNRRDMEDPERLAVSERYRAHGKSADEVAEKIFEGMLAEQFYLFTDDYAETFVRAAYEPAILGRNPIVSTWGVDVRPPEEREWSAW